VLGIWHVAISDLSSSPQPRSAHVLTHGPYRWRGILQVALQANWL
jgi:hypothetical protein